jgi:hypothetical protein
LILLKDLNEDCNNRELKTNKSSASLITTNTESNDSILTIKNNVVQGSLSCNCVWSVKFKLHRLHQTTQKVHNSAEMTPSTPSVLLLQQQQQQQQQQQPQQQQQQSSSSQGLKKLQESLVNFKIDESSKCGDLYVYTRKDEIFLLKLEEIYEQQHMNQTNILSQNEAFITNTDNSMAYNDSLIELNASYSKQHQQQQLPSRRPSFASINDNETTTGAYKLNQTGSSILPGVVKTQNLSGGSTNNNISNALNTTPMNSNFQQSMFISRQNPEYIKLSVYGLTEPDDSMKTDLCRTLQSELDCLLLAKMCKSIEKNTFKTSSAQHPDKITDEDLTFFKSISENYFDFEIPLPFIFNFNKQLRENFFHFIKQIFNVNFKAIDAPTIHAASANSHFNSNLHLSSSANNNLLRKSFSMKNKSNIQTNSETTTTKSVELENENEYDELASLIYNDECSAGTSAVPGTVLVTDAQCSPTVKTSQTVSNMIHSRELSFSFMSLQPPVGPFKSCTSSTNPAYLSDYGLTTNNNNVKREQDPFMILLSRILFHNSKNICIGKHTVSLVLVEALYAIKSLDVLVLSRITRSNSIGANNTTPTTTTTPTSNNNLSKPVPNQQSNQILETSLTQSRSTGPTFVFRFYCRGDNDTNAYKASLKTALNDSLLYFFSEYITRIDPELYLKKMRLNKTPAQFRKCRFQQIDSALAASTTNSSNNSKTAKKRHKSTGNCGNEYTSSVTTDVNNETEELTLFMNKTALGTELGKLINKHEITTENQFNVFTLNNFNNILFDHKNYEDTIEYFRESIRAFDYNRILNGFINDANNNYNSNKIKFRSASNSSIENNNNSKENTSFEASSESNNSDLPELSSDENSVQEITAKLNSKENQKYNNIAFKK